MRLYFYYFTFILGLFFAVLCSRRVARKNGVEKSDAVSFTVAGFSAGVIGAVLMGFFYNAVMDRLADGAPFSRSNVSLYGGLLFVPVLMLLPIRLAKKDYFAGLDTCSAGVYLLLGTAKVGCHVYGCCHGIESSFGVINPISHMKVFPVQLLEALLSFLIAFIVYRYAINEKRPKGSVYPLGLMLYGSMRFFVQFLRYHEIPAEADMLWFMDLWQTVSLFAVIAGAVWFAIRTVRAKAPVTPRS